MATNPWDAFPIVQPAGGAAPGPIIAPSDPYKQGAAVLAERADSRADATLAISQADRAADNVRADRSLAVQEQTAAQLAQMRQLEIEKASKENNGRLTTLRSLENQINRVQELFGKNVEGFNYNIPQAGVAFPNEANSQFDTTGAQLSSLGLAAFRVPGTGTVTDRDAVMFDRANMPSAGMYDKSIEEQLRGMRMRVEEEYAALGLPPPQWKGMEATPSTTADAKPEYGYDEEAGGLFGRTSDDTPVPPGTAPGGGGGSYLNEIGKGFGSIVEGAASLPGLAINPVGQLMYDALGYDQRFDTGTIIREALGLPDNTGTGDAVIQGAAGALTGGVAARAATSIAAPGAIRNALELVGRTPLRDTAAGAGAGAGMAIGEQSGSPVGAVAGALVGGVAGYGGASALARAAQPRQANALLSAADDIGATMLPADVGGAGTRMATGAVGRTLGGIPLAEGAQASIQSAGRARDTVARRIGDFSDDAGAGQDIQRGVNRFTQSSEKRAGELYEAIPVPGESQVQLTNTREALGGITEGFRSNPELSRLWANHPRLRASLEALSPTDTRPAGQQQLLMANERYRGAQDAYDRLRNTTVGPEKLAEARAAMDAAKEEVDAAFIQANRPPEGGQLSWQDMKRFRSIVGEIVGQPGVSSDGSDISALRSLYGALSSDMEATAAATSPRALQQFRRANQYWRGRESRIDDVFAGLLGEDGLRSPERVFQQVNQWAAKKGGDFGRLARTIRSLPADEASTVRSTIVSRMGMARPAGQSGTGEVFSPAEFATQWQGMSSRAKSVLFPNKQHRQDLEKLSMVMDGMKQANQFANFSNTALGANFTAQGALAFANLPIAAALAGMQFGAGKLLASPRVARWMASAPRTENPAAIRKWSESLGVIAAREPILANDIRSVQQYLAQAVEQSPGKLAARDEERD